MFWIQNAPPDLPLLGFFGRVKEGLEVVGGFRRNATVAHALH